jgi:signal transduction histidine kinase
VPPTVRDPVWTNVRLRVSRPRSLRARTALAAGLVAALLFAAAAWEMRHLAYAQQMREATSDADQQAELLLSSTTVNGWPYGDKWGKYPYELVASGGLVSQSSQLAAFEAGKKAYLPLPPADGVQVPYWGSATTTFPQVGGSSLAGTTVTAISATLPVIDLYTVTVVGAGGDGNKSVGIRLPGGTAPGATVRVYVFVTTGAAQAAVGALDRVLYPGVPLAAPLVAAVAYVATRRALRPVEHISARTAAVTATDPRERVAVPPTGDEIAGLATTINSTLERLEEASQTQRRFVADAAHELRSPLASLLATLEVAEAYPDRADWPETVATSARQARRLQSIAEDLLLLARLDAVPAASLGPDVTGRVDLGALAYDVATDGKARRLTVSVRDEADGRALIEGRPVQLERMLRNLVDNALRFAGSRVEVSVTEQDGQAVLTVQDDGPGIAPEDRERVFDRFTRLEDDRSRDTGGSGLGLPIAREIAERHQGTLRVEDSAVGARLTARLPLTPSGRRTEQPASRA